MAHLKVFVHSASQSDQRFMVNVTLTCPPYSGESHEGNFVCFSYVAGQCDRCRPNVTWKSVALTTGFTNLSFRHNSTMP